MIVKIENFRLYTQMVNSIRFLRKDKQYLLTYFSENSSLIEDYDKLGLKKQDFRYVLVPLTRIPRTGMTGEIKKLYKDIGLTPYQANTNPPKNQNFIYDPSNYLKILDLSLNPQNYRQRAGVLVKTSVYNSFNIRPDYTKILMYSINISKPLDKNITNRKIFSFLKDIKNGNINYDYFILALVTPNGCRYRLLVKDFEFNFNKLYLFLRNIKSNMTIVDIENVEKETQELESEDVYEYDKKSELASEKIIDVVKDKIDPNNEEKVKQAVKSYLKKDKEVLQKAEKNELSKSEIQKTVIKSIIFKATNNLKHAEKIANKIPEIKIGSFIKPIDKLYSDKILERKPAISTSKNLIISSANVPKLVDYKTPSHLFEKRSIDFEHNLREDISQSFKILENKEIPLKIQFFDIIDKKIRVGEIEPSDLSSVIVKLVDLNGNINNIVIDIPKINPKTGTFRIGGHIKCLLNQIILCPISFPKPFYSKFESSYSAFHIYTKETRSRKYLQIYFGSFKKLPFLGVLAYSFGFSYTMKLYDISYKISKDLPKRGEIYFLKIDSENYLYFYNVDTELKKQICMSLIVENISQYNINKDFESKEYFQDLLQNITGSVNISYLITNNLENIVDPATKQVLITKNLPVDLDLIMKYMSTKTVEGFSEDRNDISNQRIRGSEIISYIIYKQINTAYTEYKGKVLSGNKNAEFKISRTEALSTFNLTELVTDMEFANPVEEMASMTKISPIGKRVGGIGSVDNVASKIRNVHLSYYGNIDPLDTPEGGTIGVNQQLTLNSEITNSRGIFKIKELDDREKSGILSTSSALIPFIGNNDGVRTIMADNQIKQMLPLKNPEPPIVMTGYESILPSVLSENYVKKLDYDCKIIEVTRDQIIVKKSDGKLEVVNLTPLHLRSGFGRNTLSVFVPIVKVGDYVKKNEILAEGSCIKDGSLALGRTLLTGYMVYKGYNYEDGIVINEKLVHNDKLTSLHGMILDVEISEKDRVLFVANIGQFYGRGQPILRKTIGELEELLGYEEDETSFAYGQELVKKSPGGIIVDIEVFCNTDIKKFPLLKELSDRTRKRYNLLEKDYFSQRSKTMKGILIRFKIQQELRIGLGDKLTGRFGNKGVICLIEKEENMPKTPWGESLDIILNPLGIIGRMNIGQLYEMYCGLISRDLSIRISKMGTRKQIIDLFKKVLLVLDSTENNEYSKSTIDNISNFNSHDFIKLVNSVKNNGFVPLIFPPFKSPNHDKILKALKILGLESGYKLYLPTFKSYTKEKVPVGYSYLTKLEHMGDLKIHSRSTGPLTATKQPTRGKRHEGGQRLGESDTYSLISYNAIHLLSELMGPMSDDTRSKDEMISEIITRGGTDFRISKNSPARDLMGAYFIALLLDER